ncbi:hypothetical protein D0Z00_003500 [Geotrichum galactomycetum]|uniref:Uncharacterized protein n=1 Tax=Geotrichum galactomycetum TaxID=27317 RepID=A0ACB6V141_9ASCO|nr:hypothetical protein D0Z00_003500 [Geotrichum candidum]
MSNGAYAFGAGNIPSLAAVEGVNFRHGDIEDTLAGLAMASGSFISKLTGGKKFNNLAIKRVYFGNWLRDYSQAIDVGTLSKKISPELIRIVLWIMAFTEFGYGTEEFEVTSDRLGVYRAEEHIDNPKGYAEGEDARTYDKRLRGPVDPRELEIDSRTGMKNYIANENGNWPTSTEYVRKSLQKCIEKGRSSRSNNNDADQYEALRLLGQALHTLEDFSAHTNYCELVLISLGHRNVFPHVGSNCKINLNGQSVYPIVTGTFGGKDFLHSLLGGAQDSLSQVELGEIQEQLNNGAGAQTSADALKNLFGMVPVDFTADEGQSYSVGGSRSMVGDRGSSFVSKKYSSISDEIDSLKNLCSGGANSNDPEEIIAKVYPLFEFRDRVMKKIEIFMDSVPLLSTIKEKISDSLTLFIMGVIQPIIAPMLNDMVQGLHSGTEMVVNDDEQFRVWNDNNYDNPTHSQLSKDHFSAYLNEPAGKIATEVLSHVVPLVVKAWEDTSINVDDVTNEALQVFHHPSLASTPLQRKMRETMEKWLDEVENRDTILKGLTSQGVRNGQNLKTGNKTGQGKQSAQSGHVHQDGCGHNMGFKIPSQSDAGLSNFDNLSIGGGAAAAAGAYGHQSGKSSYNSSNQESKTSYNSNSSYSQNTSSSYSGTSGYGKSSNQYSSGGSSYNQTTSGRLDNQYNQQSSPGRTEHKYGQQSSPGRSDYQYGQQSSSGRSDYQYGQQSSPGRHERPDYSSGGYGSNESSYNRTSQSRPHRDDSDTYPGAGRHTYGNNRNDDDEDRYSGRKSYGNSRVDDDDNRYSRQEHNTSSRYDSDTNRFGGESFGYGQSGGHNSSSSYGRSNHNNNRYDGDYEGGNNSNRYESNSSNRYGSSTYGNESRFESENSNEYGRHQPNRFNNDDDEDYGRQRDNRSDQYGESQGYHEGSGGYSRY